jgi:hypothetical protein
MYSVLSCFADDRSSLFAAAQAHSKLRQAVAMAISSIKTVLKKVQHVTSVQQYLTSHGQHVGSVDLQLCLEGTVTLYQLPHSKLQALTSLRLSMLRLHLQPTTQGQVMFQGVLAAGVPLKQLHLDGCTLLDGEEGLAAALVLLPKLQRLSCTWNYSSTGRALRFPSSVLQALPQLTYLELGGERLQDPCDLGMQHLQGLTDLRDLRLSLCAHTIPASALSGLQLVTQLKLQGVLGSSVFEPGALAGKTQLQHLEILSYIIAGGSAGVAELLSNLQDKQQLTHLNLSRSLQEADIAPLTAYSGLTCSSKLQHLDISSCTLPATVWTQTFPDSCQWPHLRELLVDNVRYPARPAVAPAGSRIVTCCPGLQSLQVWGLEHSTEGLAPLTGLTGLTSLRLRPIVGSVPEGLHVVCQLTGLKQLSVWDPVESGRLLLQLGMHLRQLTQLHYGRKDQNKTSTYLSSEVRPQRFAAHGRPCQML